MKALIAAAAIVATPAVSMAQYIYSQPTYSAPVYRPKPVHIPRSAANDAIPGQMQRMREFQMQQQINRNTRAIQQQRINNIYGN